MTLPTVRAIKLERERSERILYGSALNLIEKKARALLASHKNLDEFVMAMGGWIFTRKNDESGDYISMDRCPAYVTSFARMMSEFEDIDLKVTGEPMRFTASGPVVKDWGATDLMDGDAVAKKFATAAKSKKPSRRYGLSGL